MKRLIKTQIRINNTNNTTYVLKEYDDTSYVLNIYQKNVSKNCYYLSSSKTGYCQ